jgi:phosphoribosylanthranilate isomerase
MIDGIQVKVCGLTSPKDAEDAAACGADYLGFILHPGSPRHVPLKHFKAMAEALPMRPKVAVVVEPAPGALAAMRGAGFDLFQVHFRHDIPVGKIEAWSREAGPGALWLAPKLPPGVDVAEAWLALAPCILLDTFDPALFGGTGRTGDWPKFRRHAEAHTEKTWILSGGLGPENVGAALVGTGALVVDVNSGVESAPGVKDHAKLRAFFAAVRRAAGGMA